MNYKVQFLLIIGVIALCLSYMSFPADACSCCWYNGESFYYNN